MEMIRFYGLLSHTGWGMLPLVAAVGFGFLIGRLRQAWLTYRSWVLLVSLIAAWVLFFLNVWFCLAGCMHAGCAIVKARQAQCMTNVKKLSTAMMLYAQDHDEHFPPSGQWSVLLQRYEQEKLRCPQADTPISYSMNKAMSKTFVGALEAPADTVLLFESDVLQGGADALVSARHSGGSTIGFADGHSKWVNARTKLNWAQTPIPTPAPKRQGKN